MKPESKFKGIFRAREPEPVEPAAAPGAPPVEALPPSPALPVTSPAPPPAGATPAPAPRPPGRPPGKRSDPSYVQVTAYIPAETHHQVKRELLEERQGREFSELVAELLDGWLKSRT